MIRSKTIPRPPNLSPVESPIANPVLWPLMRVAAASNAVEFAVLDEVFGSQGRLGRRALIEALGRLIPPFRQLFIVTHAEDVQDLFPSILPIPLFLTPKSHAECRHPLPGTTRGIAPNDFDVGPPEN